MVYIIGQCFGIIAIALGFLSYQMRTQRQILFVLSVTAIVFCLHYYMIGALTGMAMNGVNLLRNIMYDYRTRKESNSKLIPIVFAIIQGVIGLLTWEAWYSIFILLGIVINTVCMSFSDPQKVRKSILFTSPLVLTYDIFARSIGGIVFEAMSFVSGIVGLIRNRKREKNETTAP